jgi:hypothetical protein
VSTEEFPSCSLKVFGFRKIICLDLSKSADLETTIHMSAGLFSFLPFHIAKYLLSYNNVALTQVVALYS